QGKGGFRAAIGSFARRSQSKWIRDGILLPNDLLSFDVLESRAAGEVLAAKPNPSPAPASSRRTVCAPKPMSFPLYRRPPHRWSLNMLAKNWLRSFKSRLTGNHAPRATGKRPAHRWQLQALEDRCVPTLISGTPGDDTFIVTRDANQVTVN